MDSNNKTIQSELIRKAINIGFDKENDKISMNGIGIAASGGFIPHGLPGYSRNKNNEYDMSKAKKLVNEYKKYNESIDKTYNFKQLFNLL